MSPATGILEAVSEGRVLVVDDNPVDTLLAARLLSRAGLTDVRR